MAANHLGGVVSLHRPDSAVLSGTPTQESAERAAVQLVKSAVHGQSPAALGESIIRPEFLIEYAQAQQRSSKKRAPVESASCKRQWGAPVESASGERE